MPEHRQTELKRAVKAASEQQNKLKKSTGWLKRTQIKSIFNGLLGALLLLFEKNKENSNSVHKFGALHNILWNLTGNALPLLAGVVAFPSLLNGLGIERFGLLSLAWVLVGYLGLFDLGLSRAVTHVVAERTSASDTKAASRAAATALTLMWLLGTMAAAVAWALTAWLAHGLLEMPAEIRQEAVASFRVLVLSIPFVIHTAGLRGLLEAQNAFRVASVIRIALGVGTFCGPLIVVSLGGGLVEVMAILVAVRFTGWLAYKQAVTKCMRVSCEDYVFDRKWVGPLLTYGGWITVTNIVGPLMVYLDRFIIGTILSVATISYYTVPYEVVTRAWAISAAIAGVLFPLFSASWNSDKEKGASYMQKGALYVMFILFPVLALAAYFAPEILGLWLGEEFAQKSTVAFRWLAAGTLVSAVAQIFFALVQGAGRSDWTGKLHVAEAIPYWLLLLLLLNQYGVAGAAMAWFARSAVDAFALIWLAGKLGSLYRRSIRLPLILLITTTTHLLGSNMMEDIVMRSMFLAISQLIFVWFAWQKMMLLGDRAHLQRMLVSFKWSGYAR